MAVWGCRTVAGRCPRRSGQRVRCPLGQAAAELSLALVEALVVRNHWGEQDAHGAGSPWEKWTGSMVGAEPNA